MKKDLCTADNFPLVCNYLKNTAALFDSPITLTQMQGPKMVEYVLVQGAVEMNSEELLRKTSKGYDVICESGNAWI